MAGSDDQVIQLKNALKDIAAGDWKGAAHRRRNTASEGAAARHNQCKALVVECENM